MQELYFNLAIRKIMLAPRGKPSPAVLADFHRVLNQYELAKCFLDKKNNARPRCVVPYPDNCLEKKLMPRRRGQKGKTNEIL